MKKLHPFALFWVGSFLALSFQDASAAMDQALHDQCARAVTGYTELFKTLVNINSGSNDIEGLNRKKDALVSHLKNAGFDVAAVEAAAERAGTYNIVARLHGTGMARILICSHYDTVWPKGEADKRPFKIENGMIFGPGAGDTHSGVVGSITALKILKDANFKNFKTITLLLSADEEIGSHGARDLLLQEAAQHDVAFSTEGGGRDGDSVAISCRGGANAVLSVKGVRAHTGRPHLGHNAGVELAKMITATTNLSSKENFTDCSWVLGSFGTNTNVVPDTATATMNIRADKKAEFERVRTALEQVASAPADKGCTASVDFQMGHPAFETSEGTQKLADCAAAIYETELGKKLSFMKVPAGSDAGYLCQKAPTLEGLGMSNGKPHQKDEFSSLAPVPDRLYLLARLIQEVGTGRIVPLK